MSDQVQCICRNGYGEMRQGEIGELIEVIPSSYDEGFTFPEYWKVKLSTGKIVTGHSYRFKRLVDK